MNKVMLMGRLTRDPEMRYSNAAEPVAIARFGLAVDRRISRERRDAGEQSADFINCTAFRNNAEFIEKYFRKGQMVSIVGRLQVSTYDDNQGQKRWSTEVIVEEQFFAESRASYENRSQGQAYNDAQIPQYGPAAGFAQQPSYGAAPKAAPAAAPGSDTFFQADNSLDDDDLPF